MHLPNKILLKLLGVSNVEILSELNSWKHSSKTLVENLNLKLEIVHKKVVSLDKIWKIKHLNIIRYKQTAGSYLETTKVVIQKLKIQRRPTLQLLRNLWRPVPENRILGVAEMRQER